MDQLDHDDYHHKRRCDGEQGRKGRRLDCISLQCLVIQNVGRSSEIFTSLCFLPLLFLSVN